MSGSISVSLSWRIVCAVLLLLPLAAVAEEALWEQLRQGGKLVLIRHSLTTPGVGDPQGFRLDDCSTQRNLSEQGRTDARRLGEAFRANRVPIDRVLTSPWCRCVETSKLAFGGAEVLDSLSNVFGRPQNSNPQVQALKATIAEFRGQGNLVMVSHGSTIGALTGVQLAMSEMLVATPHASGGLTVIGRLPLR